jgi:prepilin-type N-terminal cleavage/methylation domain-containing protein
MKALRTSRRETQAGQRGFSLVEVMVASVVLGLTVSAVAIMIVNSSALRLGNDHDRQARIIVQEELEDPVHHFSFYDGTGNIDNASIFLDFGEADQAATTATRNLTVSNRTMDILGTSVPYKQVVSAISWTEGGQARSVALAKRIAKTK